LSRTWTPGFAENYPEATQPTSRPRATACAVWPQHGARAATAYPIPTFADIQLPLWAHSREALDAVLIRNGELDEMGWA